MSRYAEVTSRRQRERLLTRLAAGLALPSSNRISKMSSRRCVGKLVHFVCSVFIPPSEAEPDRPLFRGTTRPSNRLSSPEELRFALLEAACIPASSTFDA